ncbi:MAG TPA: DNA polymerase III subunit beta [Anaerolineaceae bacterium]|nr:DNA polymerase III subunit beta [Anaerolineales bacterium]HIQ08088.1 DNA polymerase III subunit beta [Anaerolineaceae bacterium]
MEVTVSREALARGLNIVSRAVATRSTLPVLANVLLATDEGRLRLSATNLEMAITCWIPAKVAEEGAITVPARTFNDLVSTFPNEGVTLKVEEGSVTLDVRCASSHTDIRGIDADEFPPLPVPDFSDGVRLLVEDFREMVQQVAFAASTDDARPVLTGVLLRVRGDQMTLAASDGYRLSVRYADLPQPAGSDLEVIVPARALTELARIADPEGELALVAPPERGQIIFRVGEAELVSQLIDGEYPAFEQIIPRSYHTRTVLSTEAFLKACKQAEIFAREGTNIVRLDITPGGDKPGELRVSSQSETGSSETTLLATVEGDPIVIAFNVRFLREALEAVKSPEVALETTAPASPGVVRAVGDEHFLHVVMPMHLS